MFLRIVTALTRAQKQATFILIDMVSVWLALTIVLWLMAPTLLHDPLALLPLMATLGGLAAMLGWVFGLTRIKLNAYELRAASFTIVYASALGAVLQFGAPRFLTPLPVGTGLLYSLLTLFFAVGWRITLRHLTMMIYLHGEDQVRVLIYGAGHTGQQLAAALRQDRRIRPIAFVDDNPALQSQTIAGLRVYAPAQIPVLIAEKRIDRAVLAMPSISAPALARISQRLNNIGCEAHVLPSFAALIGEGAVTTQKAPLTVQDLLGRNRLEEELPGVTDAYAGQRILVSGAGGSIGAELCRQLLSCNPSSIVLVDHSELALYTIDKELRDSAPDLNVVPVLGSVLDANLMRDVLMNHNVDVVLHAAAYKHLPLVEQNALSGLANNVLGTKVLAEAARACGVERFILVSTDKAVRPTNVMGASKRLAEMVIQDLAARSKGTRFSMVRFGNVLGSSGSVIPLFEEQIARGGPVTLTDWEVTRYFMTISEAARLVLLTGSFARGGDVFVLDMGDPVPIRKLAMQMIEGAGYTVKSEEAPDGDIEIRITGLRPGEKLHEELLISADMLTTPHPKILRAQEGCPSEFEMATALKDLRQALDTRDDEAARAVLARWVESADLDSAIGQQ